jgi:hypothetical protein
MAALTVLVPIYNESHWFSSGNFVSNWRSLLSPEVLALFRCHANDGSCLDLRFCLWPSQDDDLASSTVLQYISQLPTTINAQLVVADEKTTTELDRPSVVASLELGLQQKVTSPLLMVCPIDCALSPAAWTELLELSNRKLKNFGPYSQNTTPERLHHCRSIALPGYKISSLLQSLESIVGPISLLCRL